MAEVRSAAELTGMSPGAYAADVVVAVARQELTPLPADDTERVLQLLQARIDVSRIGVALIQTLATASPKQTPNLTATLTEISRAVRRIEQAADAIAPTRRRRPGVGDPRCGRAPRARKGRSSHRR